MVDLVDRAVVIGGLEHWQWDNAGWFAARRRAPAGSLLPRLKALSTRPRPRARELLPQGARVRRPGSLPERRGARARVPALVRVPGLPTIGPPNGVFEPSKHGYRTQCESNKPARRSPCASSPRVARHLSDFPWIAFAHTTAEGGVRASRALPDEGATGDLGRIRSALQDCGDSADPMSAARAPSTTAVATAPGSVGARPNEDPCELKSELLVRTASDAYFAQVVSALRLPPVEPRPDAPSRSASQRCGAGSEGEDRRQLEC
jgi:hypothetical protein